MLYLSKCIQVTLRTILTVIKYVSDSFLIYFTLRWSSVEYFWNRLCFGLWFERGKIVLLLSK